MSTALFDLSGKRALITGSSQGIGYAIARGLGQAGAEIIINGRDRSRLDQAVERLRSEGLGVRGVDFDVTDANMVNRSISMIETDIGAIDILVNNAGIQRRVPLHEADDAVWQDVIDTNLNSVFRVGRAVARYMIERKQGKIINICSLMSELGRPTVGPYTAAKGGAKMLTRAMCADWAQYNIQVNGIGPGYFKTELNKALYENREFDQWLCKRTPAGRWGEVEELVGSAVFLASNASSFINGQIIYVDGGVLACL